MKSWKEKYGDTIDGTLGIMQWQYELDQYDFDEVVEQLLDMYPEPDDRPDSATVTIDGIDFEVELGDYL